MSASCRSQIARSSGLAAWSAIWTITPARWALILACSSREAVLAASVSRRSNSLSSFCIGSLGTSEAVGARSGRGGWKKNPLAVNWALGGQRLGQVDDPPDVAHLDQRADLHLTVLVARLSYRHDILVNATSLVEPSVAVGTIPGRPPLNCDHCVPGATSFWRDINCRNLFSSPSIFSAICRDLAAPIPAT